MAFLDNIQQIVRYGTSFAAKKDAVLRKSIAASAQDSIFQFPCLISNSVSVDMSAATARLLDRNYASFVQIVLSQVANVDISVDRTPVQFLRRIHQNMKLESVDSDDEVEHLITENFYDGNVVVGLNQKRGYALFFEGASENQSSKFYKLNLDESREYLSDFDLKPFMEADEPITRGELIDGILTNSQNRVSREQQTLTQKIYGAHKAPTMVDNDVKKINDLQPYTIQVRLNVINEKNEFVEYWDVIVGVKTHLHLIKSDEIIDNIARTVQNRSVTFNLIRWTTGEISFFKDLILHIDDIKFDMMNRSKGYSAWFPTLKRLKDRKIDFKNFNPKKIIPNSTVVISSSDMDILEQRYGIYVKDTSVARRIIDNLFLMAFIILDEGSQTIDVMYQNSATFETIALETVQREVVLNSNKFGNEIARMFSQRK